MRLNVETERAHVSDRSGPKDVGDKLWPGRDCNLLPGRPPLLPLLGSGQPGVLPLDPERGRHLLVEVEGELEASNPISVGGQQSLNWMSHFK